MNLIIISSGAAEAILDEKHLLASGDFFGEIWLIKDESRNAAVVAAGFCDLLVLETAEFKKLISQHSEMKKVIEQTDEERIKTLSRKTSVKL